MSKVEQRVKPLLLALGSNERPLSDLSHGEQTLLALWTRKTALVLHAASYSPPVIPRKMYTLTKEMPRLSPPGVSVVAMQAPDLAEDILAISALQSDRFMLIRKPGTADDFVRWKISVRVGILQLLVTYCSDPAWNIVGWRGVHIALWPGMLTLFYTARLRRDLVVVRKESGTALFHVSLGISTGLTQQDIDLVSRPPLEQELERLFSSMGSSPHG